MQLSSKQRSHAAFETMSAGADSDLLEIALGLQRAAQTNGVRPLLRGRNFALLSPSPDAGDAALFRRAALELGGHVAHLGPNLTAHSSCDEILHTARLLGRLYDAIECQDVPPEVVRQLEDAAGVPVFDNLTGAMHPTARLAEQLDADVAPADRRRYVLQAVLLATLS